VHGEAERERQRLVRVLGVQEPLLGDRSSRAVVEHKVDVLGKQAGVVLQGLEEHEQESRVADA